MKKILKKFVILFILVSCFQTKTVFAEENILKGSIFFPVDDLGLNGEISKIVFRDDGFVPTDPLYTLNLDENDNGLIKGYIVEESGKKVYYVVSNGTMYLNPNVNCFIMDFFILEDIEGLDVLDFSKVETIDNFLVGSGYDDVVVDLNRSVFFDFSDIDLSNCTYINSFISNFMPSKNVYIDLSSWNLSSISDFDSSTIIGLMGNSDEDSSIYIDASDWKLGGVINNVFCFIAYPSVTVNTNGWDFSNINFSDGYEANVNNIINHSECNNFYFYASDWNLSNFDHINTLIYDIYTMGSSTDFIVDFSGVDFSSINSFNGVIGNFCDPFSNPQIKIPNKTGDLDNSTTTLYGSSVENYFEAANIDYVNNFTFSLDNYGVRFHNVDDAYSASVSDLKYVSLTKEQLEATYTLSDDLTKENYTFEGWYDNPQFEGEPITSLSEVKHYNLYAKFVAIPEPEPDPVPTPHDDSPKSHYVVPNTGVY